MIIIVLILLGLCLGSFVNALVYRLHEQSSKQTNKDLSILKGRSMCPNCHHQLALADLIPVFSWAALGGKCRYCKKPISWQYPLVELATSGLFVFSYIFWPSALITHFQVFIFALWLIFLVGFVALLVYDLRWFLLPDRIVFPLIVLAIVKLLAETVQQSSFHVLFGGILAVLASSGVFYALFTLSKGKWIGGGDVKLTAALGLILGGPARAVLLIFLSSVLGSLVSVPLLLTGKARRDSHIPYGPFLIIATIICYLFGASIIAWYKRTLLLS